MTVKQTRRFLSLFASVVICVLSLVPVALGQANNDTPLEQLQQQKKNIEQQQQDLEAEQNRLQNLERDAAQQLDGLQDSITITNLKIEDTEFQINQAQERLKRLENELTLAQENYETVRIAAVRRLQFMQRQKDAEGWAVLLKSENLNEFLERRYLLRKVYQADSNVMADVQAQADLIVKQQQGVEAQKNSIALLRQQLLARRDQFEAQADQQNQLIGRLKDNRGALEAAQAQLVRDSESLGNLIRQRIAAASGIVLGTGQMSVPTAGSVTSRFGSRLHPVLGYRRFHAGIDFGASYGTGIVAADSGKVIFSGWYGGYGNSVIIDHGGGLTTLYAHASRLNVREGQAVSKGQSIAAVGSTGLSTGPHLHFEVRRNGNPVDPMGFL
ncbi:peptidoglycan DD-metalloendopeptidase family protein [Leptolyngbya cf. ectocarpi LEGE 11479]|uniref:Peptidoglycan DD-metalloendopeptidase family protein n=1 Tax=Leptolyngbya cf. ectocarpi LEGE 11479 TaxID=1828722 RepID=A0A929FCK1_LEPEC|nr:M23 family metallopeptidase [Leptolyngbya ectocarpi]MBE9069668.1 peptidoglycan DD-metalloendopeptidase family protein [Leptolyngbya cf. ectocarpi LEGE 11479]